MRTKDHWYEVLTGFNEWVKKHDEIRKQRIQDAHGLYKRPCPLQPSTPCGSGKTEEIAVCEHPNARFLRTEEI